MANKVNAQKRVAVDYSKIVWGQLNLTNTVGYEDQTGDLFSIAIIRYDTVFADDGSVESVSATDFIVKINKEDFKTIKSAQKAFWVHAKWVIKNRNGVYVETTPPKNLNRPGKKLCLVFQFGAIEKMQKPKSENQANNSSTPSSGANTTNSSSGCPTTPCPQGKVRNPVTCNCEPDR